MQCGDSRLGCPAKRSEALHNPAAVSPGDQIKKVRAVEQAFRPASKARQNREGLQPPR